jgi:signal transduction histidine kinase
VTEFALVVALGTLAAGLVLAVGLRLLPTVRLQLAALALVAVALPLTAVTVGGLVMFHMDADVKLLEVGAASASTALLAALLLGHSIGKRVHSLERAAARVAAGELSARAPASGPRELAQLGVSFNEMATSVERLFEARKQFVAWASHDLRTPLAAIQAMLEAVEDGLAAPEDYLPALTEQSETLRALIDDLFELAQIDAGALTLELKETSLADLVSACTRALEAEARARHVRLDLDLDERLPDVRCAPEQVQRVLQNLLTNALRHTPSDGSVVVSARPVGSALEVLVEDTGEGLTEQIRARMFDRFWRGDPARSPSSGRAGLGLAIARGLIEAQGGRIWAENRPAGGARVIFSLPVAGRARAAGERSLASTAAR